MWRYTSAGVGRLERVVARASASGAPWRHIRRQLAAAAAAASSSPAPVRPAKQIRNIAVVAHVDHGKTTLVNQLLKAGGIEIKGDEDRLLDSLELESERGITIMSKATRIDWGDHQLNIVDTPGHQDFGGEVERVLSMVDGALVLVDALEGVRPQTKYVVVVAVCERSKKKKNLDSRAPFAPAPPSPSPSPNQPQRHCCCC